jgi:hypothetical protein
MAGSSTVATKKLMDHLWTLLIKEDMTILINESGAKKFNGSLSLVGLSISPSLSMR